MNTLRSLPFIALLLGSSAAFGKTLHVPADHKSIQAALTASQPGDESETIQAAVILKTRQDGITDELRQHCAQQLPWYAVPESICLRESFPRTTSGKIDRRELRGHAIEGQRAEAMS